MKRGYSLLELLVVLAVMAVLLGVAMPATAGWRDGAAVRAATDELASGLAWTRMAAASHGGARLVLEPRDGRFRIETASGWVAERVELAGRYGVRVDAGPADSVVFLYDGYGIGRLSNRTVRIHRGQAEAGVTVSLYGRYRRW